MTASLSIAIISTSPVAHAQNFQSTFYFHRQSSFTINQQNGTLWTNSTQLWSATAQTEDRQVKNTQSGVWDFYSRPALPADLVLAAPVSLNVWLSANTFIAGTTITETLLSVSPTGGKTILGSATISSQDLTTSPSLWVLTINTLSSSTVPQGNILDFQTTVDVSGGSTRIATLSFDRPAVSSRVILTLTDHHSIQFVTYHNSSLVLVNAFSKNWSSTERQVVAIANVSDALGLYDMSRVNLTVMGPSGSQLVANASMTRPSGTDSSFSGLWQLSFPYSENEVSGRYNGTVGILDMSGNMKTSQVFSFNLFATWPFTIHVSTASPSPGPLDGVLLRVFDGASLAWSGSSDASGTLIGFLSDDRTYSADAAWQGSIVGSASSITVAGPSSLNMTLQVRQFQFSGLFRDGDGRTLDSSPTSLELTGPNGTIVTPNPNVTAVLQDGVFLVNSVLWKGLEVAPPGASFNPSTSSQIRLKIFDLSVIVTDVDNRALQNAAVVLVSGGLTIASGTTDDSGVAYFRQLPSGQYAITVTDSVGQVTKSVTVDGSQTVTVQTSPATPPAAPLNLSLFGLVAAGAMAGLGGLFGYRRFGKLKFSEKPFEYLETITGGGIPGGSSILISGETGVGKTLLSEQIAVDWLKKGRPCVYISYGSLPAETRKRMKSLGPLGEAAQSSEKLALIDCYSAQSKIPSEEKYLLERPFDLTTLGITMSQAINDVGEKEPLVVLDPASPLFSKLPPTLVVNFLEDKVAKVKGLGGAVIFTLGTGTVPKEVIGNIESLSDGILALSSTQGKDGIVRSLRVLKMRNQTFKERTYDFKIKPSKGIRFLAKRGFP